MQQGPGLMRRLNWTASLERAARRIMSYIQIAKKEGATLLVAAMHRLASSPRLVREADNLHRLHQRYENCSEEVFGPVLQ